MKSTVLCYNLKGTKKGRQLSMIFSYLGYKVRHVEPQEYNCPVGVLAGAREEDDFEVYEGEGFKEEMLVLNPATEDMLDKALFLMRKEKAQVGLKAILTENNAGWTSPALYEEIRQEHEYMTQKKGNKAIEHI